MSRLHSQESSEIMLVVINGPRLQVSLPLSLSDDKTRDKKEEFFVLNSLLPNAEIVGVGSG